MSEETNIFYKVKAGEIMQVWSTYMGFVKTCQNGEGEFIPVASTNQSVFITSPPTRPQVPLNPLFFYTQETRRSPNCFLLGALAKPQHKQRRPYRAPAANTSAQRRIYLNLPPALEVPAQALPGGLLGLFENPFTPGH